MSIFNQVVKGSGTQPTGTKSITANGSYDVTDFATADVNVPTTAPAHYIEKTVVNGQLRNSGASFINLSGVTSIAAYALYHAYEANNSGYFPAGTAIDMSSITQISTEYACTRCFSNNTGVASIDLSGLTTISGSSACQSMLFGTAIRILDLPSLTTISGSDYAAPLTQVCSECTQLTTVKMNALNTISVQFSSYTYTEPFGSCTRLETVEFGGLTASTFASKTNQLQYLFNSSTGSSAPNGCTVHFPSNFDPADPNHTFDASTLAGYPTFGGSASYIHVAFDLPATE